MGEGKLSNRTIVRHLTVLHGIFKRAKRAYGLAENPAAADVVERPRVVYTGEFDTLERDEVELPRLRDIVDGLSSAEHPTALQYTIPSSPAGVEDPSDHKQLAVRIRDEKGQVVGTMAISLTAAKMSAIGAIAATGDLGHFERMTRVAKAGRRPAAILFADLEGSSPLARRLSTASYFIRTQVHRTRAMKEKMTRPNCNSLGGRFRNAIQAMAKANAQEMTPSGQL